MTAARKGAVKNPHPNPPPLAGEGARWSGCANNPPPLAGEGRSPQSGDRVGADGAGSVSG